MQPKILIVDDDKNIVKMLVYKFNKNFKVQFALRAKAALEIIKEDFPDVMLIDCMMPEMDGMELAEEVRKMGRPVPIVMLTAKNDADTIFTAAKKVDDYIVKPFEFADVLARVLITLLKYKQEQINTLEQKIKTMTNSSTKAIEPG